MSNDLCSGIQPVGSFQYNPNLMTNCGIDFDNLDIDYSTYPMGMCGGMMGMNGSIFGGMPWGGGCAIGSTPEDYFNYMKEYQKLYNEFNIDQQKMQRNTDLQLNGAMESIQEHAANLKDKIEHDEQDQIMEAYNKYIDSIKNAYGNATEEEINSRALSTYTQMNGGKSLIQDLREHGHSSEVQGFIQALTLGTYAKNSAEDNIAKITGQSVPTGEKTKQNLGRIAGAGAFGGIAYGLTKFIASHTTLIANTARTAWSGKAGKIGLLAAAAAAVIAFITGKVTSSSD